MMSSLREVLLFTACLALGTSAEKCKPGIIFTKMKVGERVLSCTYRCRWSFRKENEDDGTPCVRVLFRSGVCHHGYCVADLPRKHTPRIYATTALPSTKGIAAAAGTPVVKTQRHPPTLQQGDTITSTRTPVAQSSEQTFTQQVATAATRQSTEAKRPEPLTMAETEPTTTRAPKPNRSEARSSSDGTTTGFKVETRPITGEYERKNSISTAKQTSIDRIQPTAAETAKRSTDSGFRFRTQGTTTGFKDETRLTTRRHDDSTDSMSTAEQAGSKKIQPTSAETPKKSTDREFGYRTQGTTTGFKHETRPTTRIYNDSKETISSAERTSTTRMYQPTAKTHKNSADPQFGHRTQETTTGFENESHPTTRKYDDSTDSTSTAEQSGTKGIQPTSPETPKSTDPGSGYPTQETTTGFKQETLPTTRRRDGSKESISTTERAIATRIYQATAMTPQSSSDPGFGYRSRETTTGFENESRPTTKRYDDSESSMSTAEHASTNRVQSTSAKTPKKSTDPGFRYRAREATTGFRYEIQPTTRSDDESNRSMSTAEQKGTRSIQLTVASTAKWSADADFGQRTEETTTVFKDDTRPTTRRYYGGNKEGKSATKQMCATAIFPTAAETSQWTRRPGLRFHTGESTTGRHNETHVTNRGYDGGSRESTPTLVQRSTAKVQTTSANAPERSTGPAFNTKETTIGFKGETRPSLDICYEDSISAMNGGDTGFRDFEF